LKDKPQSQRADRPEPTCKDEVGLIADYLAGRLDPTVLAAFEQHLSQCRDCTAFLNTYKKTIEATKSFLRIQSLKISPMPLRLPPKGPGLLTTLIFWLHLFISNIYLTAG
jgi:anti-sigma factor RsiW